MRCSCQPLCLLQIVLLTKRRSRSRLPFRKQRGRRAARRRDSINLAFDETRGKAGCYHGYGVLQPSSLLFYNFRHYRHTCHHLFPRLLLVSTSSSDNPLSTSSSWIVPYPDLLPNDAPSPASSPPPLCRRSSSPSDPVPSSPSSFPAAAASR